MLVVLVGNDVGKGTSACPRWQAPLNTSTAAAVLKSLCFLTDDDDDDDDDDIRRRGTTTAGAKACRGVS